MATDKLTEHRLKIVEKSLSSANEDIVNSKIELTVVAQEISQIADSSKQTGKGLDLLRKETDEHLSSIRMSLDKLNGYVMDIVNRPHSSANIKLERWQIATLICIGAILFSVFTANLDDNGIDKVATITGKIIDKVLK